MNKLLYLCFLLFAGISAQLDVGDRCNFDVPGKCTFLEGCPVADLYSRSGIWYTFPLCGWKGGKEIICCPLPEDLTDLDRNRPRKSEEVCLDYAKKSSIDMEFYIFGGVNAKLKEFPHMAAVGFQEKADNTSQIQWRCGGSLISENFVLTAAHCLVNPFGLIPVVVRLGKLDLLGNDDNVEAQDIRIAKTYPHLEYSPRNRANDIALLRLKKAVNFTEYVSPACLYTKNDTPKGLMVTGWGETENGTSSRYLLKAKVEPVEPAECKKAYNRSFITPVETQLCAIGGQDIPSDTCQGDSGGPIQVINKRNDNATSNVVIGVTSVGRECGGTTPSVYTRVYSYLDWIESIVWSDAQF